MRTPFLAALALTAFVPVAALAQTPCGSWSTAFAPPGVDTPIESYVEHDDGSGLALYAAGPFTQIGDRSILGVARWDGAAWSQVGNGLRDATRLVVFDDGAGAKLYASGRFRAIHGAPADWIARWNGTSWEALAGAGPNGTSDQIHALCVHDDGSGSALYVAGAFRLPGFGQTRRIARWNGSTWTDLSTGVQQTEPVRALATHDDGSGAALYLGFGGDALSTTPVHRWNGTTWSAVSAGFGVTGADVFALATYASGGTTSLYAAGNFGFGAAGAPRHAIARLDAGTWSAVGGGVTGASVLGFACAVHDDGSGARLHLGGVFEHAGGLAATGVANWDGATWRVPAHVLAPDNSGVYALASHDDGSGAALYVSGSFQLAGTAAARNAAVLRGNAWSAIASGTGATSATYVARALDAGNGEALYVGGQFLAIGSQPIAGVARFDGATWTPLGSVQDVDGAIHALTVFDGGSGPEIYAAGSFTRIGGVAAARIARFDGTNWHALGGGLDNAAYALTSFDDGSGDALYVAGVFTAAGGSTALRIARWNGAAWSSVGVGANSWINDVAVHDDGGGAALYACGAFTAIGGIAAPRIARWNGSSWSAFGASDIAESFQYHDLEVHDDGVRRDLYVAGTVFLTGRPTASSITRWDGTQWHAIDDVANYVTLLRSVHDGAGPRLCATSVSLSATTETRVRLWDGATWSTIGGIVSGTGVSGIEPFDSDGDGVPELHFVGSIDTANGAPVSNLARYDLCATPAPIVCAGDGSGVACPCANSGATGHGCANSLHAAGASLESGGVASLAHDTLRLRTSGLTGSAVIHAQGTSVAGANGVVLGDGLRCAGGAVMRIGAAPIANGASAFPPAGARVSELGLVTAPGSTRVYQAIYRNAASFCTNSATNGTNGLSITWTL